MHTSIIYVTKKVIHWGANHPIVAITPGKPIAIEIVLRLPRLWCAKRICSTG